MQRIFKTLCIYVSCIFKITDNSDFVIVQQLFQIEDEENNFINCWQFLTSILKHC